MKQRIRVKNHKKTPRIYEPVENVLDLLKHLEGYGERTAFVWPGKKRKDPENRMTYRAFTDEIKWISAAIELLGLRGGRIAVIGASSQAWVASYLGILASDSVVIPMDKELTEDAILGFLESVGATAVFYDVALSRIFESIAGKSTHLSHLISMNGEEVPEDARFYTFERWLKIGEEGVAGGYEYPPVTDSRKLAEMLFTSGTTGTSKCVMLCQENVFSVVTSACETVDFGPDDMVMSVLPLHHTYELACMLALLNYGATSAVNDTLPHVLPNLQRFKPTGLVVVPLYVNTFHKRIWTEAKKSGKEKTLRRGIKLSNFLLACGIDVRAKLFKTVTDAFGGRLEKIICGGAALNPSLIRDFESIGISIYEGFGITECSPLTNVTPYYARKPGSVGPAVPACTVRIAAGGDKNDAGFAEGEIQVKGKNVMLGYYNNDEANRGAFTEDGWFRTGDVGYMDEDGYLYITGRLKSVIVLDNGKNVFPEEIEEYLERIEGIGECVVVGRKDEAGVTKLYALIYPNTEFAEGKEKEDIKSYFEAEILKLNHTLPSFKQISFVELRDTEFEKTTTRKIKRHLVK